LTEAPPIYAVLAGGLARRGGRWGGATLRIRGRRSGSRVATVVVGLLALWASAGSGGVGGSSSERGEQDCVARVGGVPARWTRCGRAPWSSRRCSAGRVRGRRFRRRRGLSRAFCRASGRSSLVRLPCWQYYRSCPVRVLRRQLPATRNSTRRPHQHQTQKAGPAQLQRITPRSDGATAIDERPTRRVPASDGGPGDGKHQIQVGIRPRRQRRSTRSVARHVANGSQRPASCG